MLQGICITLASHESVTVSHVTILYVEAVQESLSIKPVIVGGISILKFTRPIPYQGPVQPTGEPLVQGTGNVGFSEAKIFRIFWLIKLLRSSSTPPPPPTSPPLVANNFFKLFICTLSDARQVRACFYVDFPNVLSNTNFPSDFLSVSRRS